MPNRFPRDIQRRLQRALSAWNTIDPAMRVGELAVTDLEETIRQGEQIRSEIRSLQVRLTDLRNRRDALYFRGWDQVKRLRAWVRGAYGDDSSAYEVVGGTRRSERKPRKRKIDPGAVG